MATSKWDKEDRIRATIYGNCIGDAIGLATEFMSKEDVKEWYGKLKHFEYSDFLDDLHRSRWERGDWTDDGDQLILIMMSILDKEGKVEVTDFALKIKDWQLHGFPELGDRCGFGIGFTTDKVMSHKEFTVRPHEIAQEVWTKSGCKVAPNGGVMRTSILGIHEYWNLEKVIENTLAICAITHADPRCKASCVAVTTAIALMLQADPKHVKKGSRVIVSEVMKDSFEHAKNLLTDESHVADLKDHMFAKSLSDLDLSEAGRIGYTFKTMGAGFWAFRQDGFRTAIEKILKEGGDADTNCAVAGALLGCKLGTKALPDSWFKGLKHKDWLDPKLDKFVNLVKRMSGADQ